MSKSDDSLREDLILSRDNKEYRYAYGEESTDISIGTQIKVLREQREWRQEDLAREAGIQQPMVSRYENVNYSNWTLSTLKKLARAFDVWLDIRFRSFSDMVTETNRFSRESLQVPRFADDPFFKVVSKRKRGSKRTRHATRSYASAGIAAPGAITGDLTVSQQGQMQFTFSSLEAGAVVNAPNPMNNLIKFPAKPSAVNNMLAAVAAAGAGRTFYA